MIVVYVLDLLIVLNSSDWNKLKFKMFDVTISGSQILMFNLEMIKKLFSGLVPEI